MYHISCDSWCSYGLALWYSNQNMAKEDSPSMKRFADACPLIYETRKHFIISMTTLPVLIVFVI